MADDFTFRDASGTSRTGRARDEGNAKLIPIQYVATARGGAASVNCQTITVGTTAGTLASFCSGAALPANATHALFTVYTGGGDVYWTDDGTTPVAATTGLQSPAGSQGEWVFLANTKLIASASGTKIGVSFRRYDA